MALAFFEEGPASLDPRSALHVPIGAASPLWLLFAGAATSGMAYWWMTRWAARTHLEAAFALSAPVQAEVEIEVEVPAPAEVMVAAAQLVADPVEAIVEAAEHTAPRIEAPEPAPPLEPEPPESPVIEASAPEPRAPEAPKPKPKARPAEEPPSGL